MKLPPIPKWNETTDDIDYEDFCRRSLNFERSLLAPDILFPQPDQIWETVRDCHVHFRTWSSVSCDRVWFPHKTFSAAPEPIVFPFGKARLARGERVRVCHVDSDWKPLQITFIPLRYEELLESIVPEDQRKTLSHYELNLRTAPTLFRSRDEVGYFVELFKLIAEAAD
jgi:hypothetical protein